MNNCWRVEMLGFPPTHCQEMAAFEFELEEEGKALTCFCMGVIDPAHRETGEHSKRLCLMDNVKEAPLDIQIDFTDIDIAALQSTLATGMLNIYQRAQTMEVEHEH